MSLSPVVFTQTSLFLFSAFHASKVFKWHAEMQGVLPQFGASQMGLFCPWIKHCPPGKGCGTYIHSYCIKDVISLKQAEADSCCVGPPSPDQKWRCAGGTIACTSVSGMSMGGAELERATAESAPCA